MNERVLDRDSILLVGDNELDFSAKMVQIVGLSEVETARESDLFDGKVHGSRPIPELDRRAATRGRGAGGIAVGRLGLDKPEGRKVGFDGFVIRRWWCEVDVDAAVRVAYPRIRCLDRCHIDRFYRGREANYDDGENLHVCGA